jgi:hypothetical protein
MRSRRNPPMTREERAALVEEITRLVDEKASVDRRRLILPEFLEEDADITDDEPLAHYGWTRRALSRSLGLPVLGYGGGRIVLRLPDDTVAKIPYGPYGLLQSRSELQRYVSSGKAARALLLPVFDSVEVVLPPPDPHWDARRVVALIVPEARPLRAGVSSDEHKQMQLERRWQTLVARGEADALEDLRPENSGIYVDPVTGKSRAVILDYALPYMY